MKRGNRRKKNFIFVIILVLIVLLSFFYFNYNKEKITADVVTKSDIKTVDLTNPDSDTREEVKIPIIMYHHIRSYDIEDDPIGTNLSISEEIFTEHLDHLKTNGYTTITFDSLNKFPNSALPQKPIILTFDDGYDDNYQAYKLLKKNDMVGTFYIISNYIDRPGHLKFDQIIEMSESGMEIGGHTMNHLDLTNISEEKLASELGESKASLEKIIKKPVESFCYPAGKYNQHVVKMVENAGYKTATTTKTGIASTKDPRFELKRLRVSHNDGLKSFINKLND